MRGIVNTLHFRITVIFLTLLTVVFVGYYQWVEHTLYTVEWAPGEQDWFENGQEADADSLGRLLAPILSDSTAVAELLRDYGRDIAEYDAEVALFDTSGHVLASTGPDSLTRVLLWVSPVLLDSMTTPDWDYSSYPNPQNIDAYENRIVDVHPVRADGDTTQPAEAWLVASFTPLEVQLGEIDADKRVRTIRGALAILLASFISGAVVLTWISRRIRALSADMSAFRDGDFERRAGGKSGDEIGALERSFNRMADRLTGVIEELRRSEEYRAQLVANISHDLRTPMASLRGQVETLALRGETVEPAERAKRHATITSNLDTLEQLIARLFDLTRLDSGQADFRMEDFSLEELAADVIERLEEKAATAGVKIIMDAAPLSPVHGDPLRLGQVLQNLLDNAVKFNHEGGRVIVTLRAAPGHVRVCVADTGIGIPDEDLPHVFERFYTGDKSRTARGQGSGLGLAIALRIIEAHGGALTVESGTDGGAVFRFTLPQTGA